MGGTIPDDCVVGKDAYPNQTDYGQKNLMTLTNEPIPQVRLMDSFHLLSKLNSTAWPFVLEVGRKAC